MIIRADAGGLTLIRQTEHARLCGEMARAWGNARFEAVRPLERVAWAAAEHDNGWAEWEERPQLNPETRRPYTYTDIPIAEHQEIYRRGIGRAIAHDPYAGLLVSLHGSLLYARFRAGQPGADEFLAEQRAVQERVLATVRAVSSLRLHCEEEAVAANRDLVFGWDALSLFLCHGVAWLEDLEVPCDYRGGRHRVAVGQRADRWVLDPYPFRTSPLALSAAARYTPRTAFADEAALRMALAQGEQVRLSFLIAAPGALDTSVSVRETGLPPKSSTPV